MGKDSYPFALYENFHPIFYMPPGNSIPVDKFNGKCCCSCHSRNNLMKIALLITGLGMGGAENQVVNLADHYAALGHDVLLISMTGETLVRPLNVSVEVACLNMPKTAWGLLVAYRQARGLLRTFAPNVVHSHMVHANLFARLLRLTITIPRLICTAHSSNEGGAARMWAYRITDGLADMSTNVSQEALDCFIERGAVSPGKMIMVHNGIDCERFQFDVLARQRVRVEFNLPDNIQLLLAVGRFTEAKDYPNLLTAFAVLCDERLDCVLCIVGTGIDQHLLETQAKELCIDEKVRFLGLRRDIPALMSAADIFVLSSAWEGLPLVVGEAMACERVVVSTDAGGIREWLGNVGFVVPTRNSVALSAALIQSLEMSVEEKGLQGRAARERIMQHYSLTAVVARWLEIYQGNYAVH